MLVRYYSSWLPGWLEAARPVMNLKCVQPVEWPQETIGAKVLRWLPGRAGEDGDGQPEAVGLIRRLLSDSAPVLRALPLAELRDISDTELQEFCTVIGLTSEQGAWLLGRVRSRRPRAPRDVFDAIDEFLPDVPEARSSA
jgi:hypothetical protein